MTENEQWFAVDQASGQRTKPYDHRFYAEFVANKLNKDTILAVDPSVPMADLVEPEPDVVPKG